MCSAITRLYVRTTAALHLECGITHTQIHSRLQLQSLEGGRVFFKLWNSGNAINWAISGGHRAALPLWAVSQI